MRCPTCGNEVSSGEAFCGQCGTPNSPAIQAAEIASAPPPRSGLLRSYHPNASFAPPGTNPSHSSMIAPTSGTPPHHPSSIIHQPPVDTSSPHPSTGFYQESTEAMSPLPSHPQSYPAGYQQQDFSAASMPGIYPRPDVSGSQAHPFQTGNSSSPLYPPQTFPTQQGYGYSARSKITPPPQKSSHSMLIITVCICVIVALIAVIGLGTLYILKNRSTPRALQPQPATPTSIATLALTPAPSPTPTMEPSPTPSTTATPIPTPDTGFQWCEQQCITNGFSVEYPQNWQIGPATTTNIIQFINPLQQDISATFKALGPASGSANDLITTDLQENYVSQPGYTAPVSTSTTTISGETWATAVAYYQDKVGQGNATPKERVELFAIVHQGKGYLIELEAPDAHFDDVNTQSFENMVGRFQFLPNTTA